MHPLVVMVVVMLVVVVVVMMPIPLVMVLVIFEFRKNIRRGPDDCYMLLPLNPQGLICEAP